MDKNKPAICNWGGNYEVCPICGDIINYTDEGDDWVCYNPDCENSVYNKEPFCYKYGYK